MDKDADRDPEPPARIKERRERKAELERQFRERRQELEEKAAADPWEFWPETHDDRYNPANYDIPPLWEVIDDKADTVRRFSDAHDVLAETIGRTSLRPHYWNSGDNAGLTRNLSGLEATRVYLSIAFLVLALLIFPALMGNMLVQKVEERLEFALRQCVFVGVSDHT